MRPAAGAVAAPSIVRTLVPIAVGYAAAALLRFGIGLDEAALAGLTEFLGGLFAAVYYVLVRAVEQRWPKIGVLLGWASTPDSYSSHAVRNRNAEGLVVGGAEPDEKV